MSCNDYMCDKCHPYVFTEELAQDHGYDGNSLPDILWGISPENLRNARMADAFDYLWVEVIKEKIDPEKDAYIVAGEGYYKGFLLSEIAA